MTVNCEASTTAAWRKNWGINSARDRKQGIDFKSRPVALVPHWKGEFLRGKLSASRGVTLHSNWLPRVNGGCVLTIVPDPAIHTLSILPLDFC